MAGKSFVSLAWPDDPAKRLGLEVPFGTALDQVEAAARDTIAALRDELGASAPVLPQQDAL